MKVDKTLYDRIGGHSTLVAVHKTFYDKVYAHPWIGKFFDGLPQDYIEDQQTNFMGGLFGGPKDYAGKMPKQAHRHMLITEELFELRQVLLAESIDEFGLDAALKQEWLDADRGLEKSVVKRDVNECSVSPGQPIMDFAP